MKSKLRNRIIIAMLFFGIGGATVWLYATNKPSVSTPIPNNADSILCLDLINVRNEILKNYFSGEKLNPNGLFDIRTIGLKIPSYIIGFTCSENSPNTLFTSFEIEDSLLFNSWTKILLEDNYSKQKNSQFIHFSDVENQKFFSVNESKNRLLISIGLSLSTNKIKAICASVLDGENIMSEENERIKQIKNNTNIGFIWIDKGGKFTSESLLTLSVENRNIIFNGYLFLQKTFQFPTKNMIQNYTDLPSYFNMNLGDSDIKESLFSVFDSKKFEKISNINLDSIEKFDIQKIEFNLLNPQIKQDTFVTYEYDDDFNKIEKIVIGTDVSPEFNSSFLFKSPGVYSYLFNNKNIKTVDDTNIFIAFPLATVYAKEKDNTLVLNTSKVEESKNYSDRFFVVNTVFNEIDTTYLNLLPFDKKWTKNKTLFIEGIQKSDTTLIKARIHF